MKISIIRKNILKEASVLLIVSLMVLPAIVVTADTTKLKTKPIQSNAEVAGLAPNTMKNTEKQPLAPLGDRGYFYAYDVSTLYTCTFDLNAVINNLFNAGISFFSGADFGPDGNWYAVGYSGGLYMIDLSTGIPTLIGNTIPLNSLVYDSTTGNWYCCGYDASNVDSLFTIDLVTGATTFIGHFNAPNIMISLMCDNAGNMYAYDVLFSGNSSLYTINKNTGAATNPKNMGHNFCFAQEGKFDRNTGTLYLAAYDIGLGQSYLATCNPTTGTVTIVNLFSPNDQIDALAIPWTPPRPDLVIWSSTGIIGDGIYEQPPPPAITQIGGSFWSGTPPILNIFVVFIQNDGTGPMSCTIQPTKTAGWALPSSKVIYPTGSSSPSTGLTSSPVTLPTSSGSMPIIVIIIKLFGTVKVQLDALSISGPILRDSVILQT